MTPTPAVAPIASLTSLSSLPVELRLQVWNEALLEESSNRFVFLHWEKDLILPTTSLRSGIMLACRESRSCGLKFYVPLNVREVTFKEENYRINSYASHYNMDLDRLADPKPAPEQYRGVVYVNFEHHIFVTGTRHDDDILRATMGSKKCPPFMPSPWRRMITWSIHVTARLEESNYRQIRTLLVLSIPSRDPMPSVVCGCHNPLDTLCLHFMDSVFESLMRGEIGRHERLEPFLASLGGRGPHRECLRWQPPFFPSLQTRLLLKLESEEEPWRIMFELGTVRADTLSSRMRSRIKEWIPDLGYRKTKWDTESHALEE